MRKATKGREVEYIYIYKYRLVKQLDQASPEIIAERESWVVRQNWLLIKCKEDQIYVLQPNSGGLKTVNGSVIKQAIVEPAKE